MMCYLSSATCLHELRSRSRQLRDKQAQTDMTETSSLEPKKKTLVEIGALQFLQRPKSGRVFL